MKKVYIGVGHGGKDPGAVGVNGLKEKDLNLITAKACRDELEKHGVYVVTSREKDIEFELPARINQCNKFSPDVAVDIHHNAGGGGDGAEVYHTIHGVNGKKLATNILSEIKKIGQNSRGTKTKKNDNGNDYFGFIRDISCPSVIVECAFLDNKTDVKIVDTEAENKRMGVAIAHGILKYLGVKVAKNKKTKKYDGEMPKLPSKGYLGKGDRGVEVKKWQQFLVWYGCKIAVDGVFGENTEASTIYFQTKMGFSKKLIDGMVGKKTINKAKSVKK
jgi:N-acetylmuramoyl-L-alanine amidase